MKRNMKEKLMPMLLTCVLLVSAMAIVPQAIADDAVVFPDGIVSKTTGLTCGEEISYKVTDDSLEPETDYRLLLDATGIGEGMIELGMEESTKDGDLYITFNAPGWANLGMNDPKGTWDLTLVLDEDDTNTSLPGYEAQISITKYLNVRMKSGDAWLDYLVYNTSYEYLYIYLYNWTGAKYELADDLTFDITIYQPDGTTEIDKYIGVTTGIWDVDITSDDMDFKDGVGNLEYYLPVVITDYEYGGVTQTAIPVILAVTATYPDDAEWGDTLTISGYVKDGKGHGIAGYNVALYAPVNDGYELASTQTTYGTGRFSISVETGYDNYPDSFNAGTWYIGTWNTGDPMRVTENDKFELPIDLSVGFLRYYWFDVASDETATIKIESPDEITDGFEQEINITAEWNGEPFDNYAEDEDSADGPAQIHLTGIKAWDPVERVEIDEDEYYWVGETTLNADGDESYCVFDIIFNESGTGTLVAAWPDEGIPYCYYDPDNIYEFKPNVIGTLDFQVGTAADMNMEITGMPDEVMIEEIGDCWINETAAYVHVEVYGDELDEPMNASIHVSGCGLDFTIDEDDEVGDSEYLVYVEEGFHEILIAPKIGGVLTITATNATEEMSTSKDFTVKGLKGTVTTSVNDDKEISVESTETIKATVTNGAYATVKVGYYDENWNEIDCELYDLEGDGETAGEGLNGIFEFEVEEEDIEDGVGYLVVVANAAGQWMYEIVEVAPVHNLEIQIVEPANWTTSKAFTVGFDHEDWELKVFGPTDEVMSDIDKVWAVLVDEDHDEDNPLQTINFKEASGNIWKPKDKLLPWFTGKLIITAVNNSGANEHDGNITFDVDCATITYNPEGLTAGIDLENITIEVMALDANGNPLPEGTDVYLWVEDDTGGFELADVDFQLDEGGVGEFDVRCAGDLKTWVNATLGDNLWDDGNLTCGNFTINWPIMDVEPDTIFIGQANTITITAKDYLGQPIEGLNLTLWSGGSTFDAPDPVESDANGHVVFSLSPSASGKANVTIARNIQWVDGILEWDVEESVITDTYVTITSIRDMKISVSKSPVFQGDTLVVTVTSNDVAVVDADVEFAGTTVKTDATGKATFTAPDPGVDSAAYTITAEKAGYRPEDYTISVIKVYVITAITPTTAPKTGETFTVTLMAKGMPLAGATVTFNGKTATSDGDGKITLTAPSTKGDYPLTASYGSYKDYSTTITVAEGGGIPGFELFTLIAAIGIAFILLRRRK